MFPSKIDPSELPVLAMIPLIPALAALLTREPVAYLSFFAVTLLYLLLVVPVRYQLGSDALSIRSGVLRWHIPYAQMRSILPTRSLLCAPALSRDRLEILFGPAGRALISPRDRLAFLADLYVRAPHLQLPPIPNPGKP